MNALREKLNEADPLAVEPRLDEAEVRRMRQTVLTAADHAAPMRGGWTYHVLAGAMAVLVIGAVATLARRPEIARPETAAAGALTEIAVSPARQMQFATPGGTRVIWVFNPEFRE